MNKKTRGKALGLVLCTAMLLGTMPVSSISAYYEEPTAEGNTELETAEYAYTSPVGITMERLTGACVTETGNLGDDCLFVIKRGGHYYAMKDVAASEDTYESIPAVDVTDWINADGTLTVPEDTQNVAFWRYEEHPDFELGMFINGSNKFIEYSYDYTSVDGDDDYYNDADRIYTAEFRIRNFEEGYWITDPYYYSDNGVSGTLQFNGSWNEYINSYNSVRHKYELITDLRSDGNGGMEFYFRYLGTDVESTGEEVEGYLYYADCRHQYTVRHAEYDAPTCMLKGCDEYWYCEGCNEYMKDEKFEDHYGQEMPVLSALGHDWNGEKCNNCKRPVPVYSKVTNQADFDALADDTMYIVVAEYNGKYYTPDLGTMYLYMIDSNDDGFFDIYDIDDNNNDVSDMFEIDENGDGEYDYLSWDSDGDGLITETDMLEYHDQLCMAYLNDNLFGSGNSIPVKEINVNADGTISHKEVQGSVEFEMVDLYTDEEIDSMIADIVEYEDWWSDDYRYEYECVKQFVIPNMFISAPNMLPMERQYQQRIASMGDTYSWGVLFYNNADDYDMYSYNTNDVIQIPFHEACKTDSAVVFSTFDYYWYDQEHQLGMLRLRDYNGELSFVTGQEWELDGWEYVDDPITGEGYYDTHDTQACVYLYASQQISHVCEFGDWVEDKDADTHTRICIGDDCDKTETEAHGWDDGVETKAPTCTGIGEKTYTCDDCGATRTETLDSLGHEWGKWSDDGVNSDNHIRECKRDNCDAVEDKKHSWGEWSDEGDKKHKKECSVCSGTRIEAHKWDNGEVINWATHIAPGAMQYTCVDCGFFKIDEIPVLEDHEWGKWTENNDGLTHSRNCICGASETFGHNWSDWNSQDAGGYKRVCADCGAYEEFIPDEEKPVNTTDINNVTNTNLINDDIELIDMVLTNNEQSMVANGTDVKIYLKVEDISNEVPATHKAEAEAKAGDSEIGMYLDIELFKQIGTSNEIPVNHTDGKVTIKITIPDELINTDASITRTYKIIRVHEDEAGNLITDVIEGVFNSGDNSFTFETDKFSTYALAYIDSEDEDISNVPPTGNNSNGLIWISLMILSCLGIVSVIAYNKKKIFVK